MIDIGKIAKLANIKLTGKEKVIFKKQLPAIINFVSHLEKADTEKVVEVGLSSKQNVFSEDFTSPSLTSDEALSNTKSIHNNYFKVDIVLKNKEI